MTDRQALIALIGRLEATLQQADDRLRDLGLPEDDYVRLAILKRLAEVDLAFPATVGERHDKP